MNADSMPVEDAAATMEVDQDTVPANPKRKGRGFESGDNATVLQDVQPTTTFDRIDDGIIESAKGNAAKSIEGWIIMISNVHEEASEEDLQDKFGEFGDIKGLHLNLDRRTGYVKGYALIEYATREEAMASIDGASGTNLLDQEIHVDFAFVKPPTSHGAGKAGAGRKARGRSASPTRRSLVTRID